MSEERKQRGTRRRGGAPTIADVAREARCSPMTVSRVINGEGNVREGTRQQVQAAIARLNYAPNRAARSLAGGHQTRIALLYANPSASYLGEFLLGALQQASSSDIRLVVEHCEASRDELAVIRRLVESGIRGFVLPPPLCDDMDLLALLGDLGAQCVAVGAGQAPARHSSVRIDEYRAALEMTRHMIALGHSRIGFIVGSPQQSASAQRLAGYRDAMEQSGHDVPDELIAQGEFSYRSGLEAAEKLLAAKAPPTAIFASNDDMAAATVSVAHRLHLDVPGDLSVCGFDDTPIASTIWPELTTIRQPIREMSRKAIELLTRELRQDRDLPTGDPEHVTLGYQLVRRQSDGAPADVPRSLSISR